MSTRESKRITRRVAWLFGGTLVALVATWHGGGGPAQAWTTPPSGFTVSQTPGSTSNVAPGASVTFTVDLSLAASATNLIISGALDTGLRFAPTPFAPSSPYATNCSAIGATNFSCTLGPAGVGPIATLSVNAVVANVADGSAITQGANTFTAQDGLSMAGGTVTAPSASLATLTVQNENIAVTDTVSPASVFEGGTVTHTIGLTNSGAANSGSYDLAVNLTGATVTNVVCPSGGGTGTGSTTATCAAQPGLANSASGSMVVTSVANDGAASVTNAVSLAPNATNATGVPSGIQRTNSSQMAPTTPVAVAELTLNGGATVATGQAVTVCSTNNPNDVTRVRSATSSGSAALILGDFTFANGGGASYSSPSLVVGGSCGANQQGVNFTSNSAGTVAVYASYNATLGIAGRTNTVTVTFSQAQNPVPTLTNLSPNMATAGTAVPVTVTLSGANFINGSVAQWTQGGTTTQLGTYSGTGPFAVSVPANLLSSAGSATITVVNPTPGGGTSATQTFTISAVPNPVPTLTSIAPSSAGVGSANVPIVATGSNFVASSVIQWNGVSLATVYGSATSLSATIPSGNLLSAGSFPITVFTPNPSGGTSGSQTFSVTTGPTLTSLGTTSVPAGSAGFNLVVGGSNFTSQSKVKWNGTQLTTTFNTPAALTAAVPTGNLVSAGSALVTVATPGYSDSSPLTFTITAVATKLGFTVQPAGAVAATAFTTQPVVAVQDATSATVTANNTTSVTLALVGSGTLTCTGGLSKTVTAGVATFAGCAVDTAGTGLTITASATSLTLATSAAFDVAAAAPASSAQVIVAVPPQGISWARSRLTFSATTGTLSPTPTKVQFIIKRKSDNKYWNQAGAAWQDAVVLNDGIAPASGATAWTLAIAGANRRLFVNITVTVEARATAGSAVYMSAVIPDIAIR
jgi:hypothetical protein